MVERTGVQDLLDHHVLLVIPMTQRDPKLLQHLADKLVGTAGRTNLDRARAALDAIEEAGWKIVRKRRNETYGQREEKK